MHQNQHQHQKQQQQQQQQQRWQPLPLPPPSQLHMDSTLTYKVDQRCSFADGKMATRVRFESTVTELQLSQAEDNNSSPVSIGMRIAKVHDGPDAIGVLLGRIIWTYFEKKPADVQQLWEQLPPTSRREMLAFDVVSAVHERCRELISRLETSPPGTVFALLPSGTKLSPMHVKWLATIERWTEPTTWSPVAQVSGSKGSVRRKRRQHAGSCCWLVRGQLSSD